MDRRDAEYNGDSGGGSRRSGYIGQTRSSGEGRQRMWWMMERLWWLLVRTRVQTIGQCRTSGDFDKY